MLTKPKIEEICKDEFRDYLIELVKKDLQNIPADYFCRRREIATAILNCNKETGSRERTKQELCSIIPSITFANTKDGDLSKLGFRLIKGKSHYKLRWKESSYCVIVSATPSDRRFKVNIQADIAKTFF
jgi:hypothetical protein